MADILNAKWNSNGNSRMDFVIAAVKLQAAEAAIEEALSVVEANVTHGRNYQLDDDPKAARDQDLARVDNLRTAHKLIDDLRMVLVHTIAFHEK